MKKLAGYYSFIIVTVMTAYGFFAAETYAQLISATLFYPLAAYFFLLILPKKSKATPLPAKELVKSEEKRVKKRKKETKEDAEEGVVEDGVDPERRMFLKLIGSAGMTVFLFSLFTKKAHGAFFGSVPGPGTVALKDTTGQQINPAKHHPTDGFNIAEIDDSTPSYYGFTNSDGGWFIMKEESSGSVRYTSGSSNFSSNWTNRTSLTYDYFENVF